MKTDQLTGPALDWAVACCEGKLITLLCGVFVRNGPMLSPTKADPLVAWSASTNWAQGGPIVERERIDINHCWTDGEQAWTALVMRDDGQLCLFGPTPLVAAMRAYVAAKLGDTVQIPDELK